MPINIPQPSPYPYIYIFLQDLVRHVADLQRALDSAEGELREERASHDITREELEALKRQLQAARADANTRNQAHKVRKKTK